MAKVRSLAPSVIAQDFIAALGDSAEIGRRYRIIGTAGTDADSVVVSVIVTEADRTQHQIDLEIRSVQRV